MTIRLRPGADIEALKKALREGGPAEVVKLARSMGDSAPGRDETRRWAATNPKPPGAGGKPRRRLAGALVSDCKGKTRYHDEAEAKRVKGFSEKKRGTPLRAYHCGSCGGWHITSKGAR